MRLARLAAFILLLCLVPTVVLGQSTPTAHIGLQIPATGSNNWYVPLNYNFNLIDRLLSGNAALPALVVTGQVTADTIRANTYIGPGGSSFLTSNLLAQPSGIATLDNTGLVPLSQLPTGLPASTAVSPAGTPTICGAGLAARGVGTNFNSVGCIAAGGTPFGRSVSAAGSIAAAYSGPDQAAVVESSFSGNNSQLGTETFTRAGQAAVAASSTLFDYRGGASVFFSKDNYLTFYPEVGQGRPMAFTQNNSHRDPNFVVGPNFPPFSVDLLLSQVVSVPGSYKYGQETNSSTLQMNAFLATMGLNQGFSSNWTKTGLGDTDWLYVYFNYANGGWNSDDEGTALNSGQMSEMSTVPTATINSYNTVTQELSLTNVVNSSNLGDGKFLIQTKHAGGADAAWMTGPVTSLATSANGTQLVGTFTPTPTLSTAWGTVIDSTSGSPTIIDTPNNLSIPQPMNITVGTLGGSSGTFVATFGSSHKFACVYSIDRWEQAEVTAAAAVSGGRQALTINVINQFIGLPVRIIQDSTGLCGSFASFNGSQMSNGDGTNGKAFVRFPVVGSDASGRLLYAMPSGGDLLTPTQKTAYLLDESNAVSVIRIGNVAYAHLPAEYLNNSSTIAGTTTFNGSHTFLPSNNPGDPVLRFYNAKFASTGSDITVPETGTAALTLGRNALSVYRGSYVINTVDPNPANVTDGAYVQVIPNDVTWEVGGTVEQPLFYNQGARDEFRTHYCASLGCHGYDRFFSGPAISSGFFAERFHNGNILSDYMGWGGRLALTNHLIDVTGPWEVLFTNMAVDTFGRFGGSTPSGTFGRFGCPLRADGTAPNCTTGQDVWFDMLEWETASSQTNVSGFDHFRVNFLESSVDLKMTNQEYIFGDTYFNFAGMISSPDQFTMHFVAPGTGSNQGLFMDWPLRIGTARTGMIRPAYVDLGAPTCCGAYGTYGSTGLRFNQANGDSIWLQVFNPQFGADWITLGDSRPFSLGGTPIILDTSALYTATVWGDLGGNFANLKAIQPPATNTLAGVAFTGTLGPSPAFMQYRLVPIFPNGTVGIVDNDFYGLQIPNAGLNGSNFVTITCPTAVQGQHPGGTTYELWEYNGTNYARVGVCPIGGTLVDNSAHTAGPIPGGGNGDSSFGFAHVAPLGDIDFMTRDSNGFDVIDTYLKRTAAGILNLGTTAGAQNGTLNVGVLNVSGSPGCTVATGCPTNYGGTPSFALGAGAGAGAGGTLQGADAIHNFQVNTQGVPAANSVIATITLSAARPTGFPLCVMGPADAGAAGLAGVTQVFATGTGLTTYTITSGPTPLTTATTYTWNVSCP